MKWENVYIFISSTFNDMHAERDYLVKKVFPKLAVWCEERRLRLIDIDLRWGVSEADATQNKRVVQICLDRIDECRPFFLCFLGQRRGWVPDGGDVDDKTKTRFPKLAEEETSYLGNNSVTEMEILHALIDPLHNGTFRDKKGDMKDGSAVKYAFFFLRENDYLQKIKNEDSRKIYTNEAEEDKEHADRQLKKWRDEIIPSANKPLYHYTADWNETEFTHEIALPLCCPTTAPAESETWKTAFRKWEKLWLDKEVVVSKNGEISDEIELQRAKKYNAELTKGRLSDFKVTNEDLANIIIKGLQTAITVRFGERIIETETPLQKELDQQAQFLQIASEGFIERAGDFDAINNYLQSNDTRPFALTAYAGMGKTSLLAHFIDTYKQPAQETLHYRFIGGSDDSVSIERLVRSLLNELKEAGKITSDIPPVPADMMNKLTDLLAEAGQRSKTILIIDALNQLETGMNDLYWIPSPLPKNVKLIVSFKRGEENTENYYKQQKESGTMVLHSVQPFDTIKDREKLVATYLDLYFKELDEARVTALTNSQGAENPLFLKVVLSELRVFGVHNDLTAMIKSNFGNTSVKAFDAVLARMENDPVYSKISPKVLLPHILGWIAHSRYGLSVKELSGLLIREKLTDNKIDADDAVYLVLRQLRPYFAKRDGRVDFFYDSFKMAATERYTIIHQYARTSQEWHRSLAEYFETLSFENLGKISQLAYQYYYALLGSELAVLLLDYSFVKARLEAFTIYDVLEDFSYVFDRQLRINEEDLTSLKLVQGLLKLSMGTLLHDKSQLAFQLYGRMNENCGDKAKLFFDSIAEKNVQPFLQPIFSCLPAPGAMICTLWGHTSQVQEIKICENAGILASASGNEVIFWDTNNLKMLYQLTGNTRRISLSRNGKTIAILWQNGSIDIWNIKGRRKVTSFSNEYATALDISADGSLLAVMNIQEHIYLYDLVSDKRDIFVNGNLSLEEAKKSFSNIYDLFLIDDGKRLVSRTKKEVTLWDVQEKNILCKTDEIQDMYFSRFAVAAEANRAYFKGNQVCEWDYRNNLPVRKLDIELGCEPFKDSLISVTLNGKTGVFVSEDNEIVIVDMELDTIINKFPGDPGAIAISESGSMIATGENSIITLWDPKEAFHSGKTQKNEITSEVVSLIISESGESIVAYSEFTDNIIIVDVNEGEILEAPCDEDVTCLAMQESLGMLAAGCKDGSVTFWENGTFITAEDESCSKTYKSHSDEILSIDIHPDGSYIATVSRDGLFLIVNTQTGKTYQLEKLKIFNSPILGAKFTGEYGELITAFDESGMVKTIALKSLQEVSTCQLDVANKYRKLISMRRDGFALAFSPVRYGSLEITQIGSTNTVSFINFGGESGLEITGRTITDDFMLAIGKGRINEDKTLKEIQEQRLKMGYYTAVKDLATGQPLFYMYPSENAAVIKYCAISEDGSFSVTSDNDNVVTVWDVRKKTKIAHFLWHSEIKFLTCSSKTKTVIVYDNNASFIVTKIII